MPNARPRKSFHLNFCLVKKFLKKFQTKVLASKSPCKSTKLSIWQVKGIVNGPIKFEGYSCIFLEVISCTSWVIFKNPRNFTSRNFPWFTNSIFCDEVSRIFLIASGFFFYNFQKNAICEPSKISRGKISRIFINHSGCTWNNFQKNTAITFKLYGYINNALYLPYTEFRGFTRTFRG